MQAELVGRGLRVELAAVETGEVAEGLVTAVEPAGTLPPDALVRLSYAVPPAPVPTPTPTPTPAPAPAPAPLDEEEADEDEGGGNGNGNGKGNGNGEGRGRDRGGDD